MEKYLKDTYGITVYQEQVMLLSRLLANFTRGQSDGLRKAMGKKLKDKLAELKPLFINGENPTDMTKKCLKRYGAIGKIRVVCIQQEPCHLLQLGGVSNSLFESQLSGRVYGSRVEPEFERCHETDKIHGRMQGDEDSREGTGCQ